MSPTTPTAKEIARIDLAVSFVEYKSWCVSVKDSEHERIALSVLGYLRDRREILSEFALMDLQKEA